MIRFSCCLNIRLVEKYDAHQRHEKKTTAATMTDEPFQPVRLYYLIPDRSFVIKKLQSLECMVEVPHEQCWQWLSEAESKSLRFPGGYNDVPREKRPIVLGRISLQNAGGMMLQTNSISLAIEGAKFFGPRFGPKAFAIRCRVVNRCFAADEGDISVLMKTLDKDVTVIDPRKAEEEFKRDFNGVRTVEDLDRAARESMGRNLKNREDVPMVEDFPLAPEEETPDFRGLTITLHLRGIRALEHWNGNRRITLAEIITRMVEQNEQARNK
jgi:hypothetical protein